MAVTSPNLDSRPLPEHVPKLASSRTGCGKGLGRGALNGLNRGRATACYHAARRRASGSCVPRRHRGPILHRVQTTFDGAQCCVSC
jgi:hypothetical protein